MLPQASRMCCIADETLWTLQGTRLVGLNVDTGCAVREVELEHGEPRCICTVPSGPSDALDGSHPQLWIGFLDGAIVVMDTSSLHVASQQILHEGAVEDMCVVGASGSRPLMVVSVGADGRAAVWAAATQVCIGCVKVSHAALTCACELPVLSPSVVVGTSSGNVHVLALANQSEALLIPGAHAGSVVLCHAVTPQQHKVLPVSSSRAIRLWTLGSDGAFCLWGIQETARGGIVLAAKAPLVHHASILGGTSDVVCADFSIGSATVFCALAGTAGFAVVDSWTGDIVRTWSSTHRYKPVGTLRLLPRCIRRAWQVAPDGQSNTCEVPFHEAAQEQLCISSRPVSPPPPTTLPLNADYQADVSRLRNENQKLRDQIQTLLRSPLQRTLQSSSSHVQTPKDGRTVEPSLLQLKGCYSAALDVLDAMERHTRLFVEGLEDQMRHEASTWVQFTQRVSDPVDIRRRYQELLVEYHKAQSTADELSQALTTSRLAASSAQQRLDATTMKTITAERETSELREVLRHTEARLVDCELRLQSMPSASPPQRQEHNEEAEQLRSLLSASEQKHNETVDALQREASQRTLEHDNLAAKLAAQMELVESFRTLANRSGDAEEATLRRVQLIEEQLQARCRQAEAERDEAVEAMRSTSAECAAKVEHLQRLVATLKEEAALHSEEFKSRAEKLSRQQRASSETNGILIDALQVELSEARAVNSSLKKERDDLQEERNSLAHELSMERLTMKEELHRMDVQMLTLQRHVEDGALVAEHAMAQARIGELAREADSLRSDMDALKVNHRKQREGLENKIIEMASQISLCGEREAELRASLALQEKLARSREKESRSADASLQEEIEALQAQLQTQRKLIDTTKKSLLETEDTQEALIVQHRRDISVLKQKHASKELELEDHIHRVQLEHQTQIHARDDRLREADAVLAARDAAIAKWTSACDELQRRLASAKLQDHSDVEKALQEMASQRDIALDKLRGKTAEWLQAQAEYEERILKLSNSMRAEKAAHEEALGAVEGQMRRAQREMKQLAVNEVQLLRDAETAKAEVALHHQREVRMWEDRVKKLEARVQQLSEAEANIRKTHDGCATTKQRVERAIEERIEMQRQTFAVEVQRLKEASDCARNEAHEAKQELERTLKLCRKLSNDNTLLETETEDLRLQLDASSDRLRSCQRDADQLRQQTQSHQVAVQELETLREERNTCSERVRQLVASCQRLEAELDAHTQSETDLKHLTRSLEEQTTALRASLQEERDTVHQRDVELLRCKKSYEALAGNAAQQQKQMDELQQQHRIVVANLHAYELEQRDRGAFRAPSVRPMSPQAHGAVPATTPDTRAVDRSNISAHRSSPHRMVAHWLATAHHSASRSASAAPSGVAYHKLWAGQADGVHAQPTNLLSIAQTGAQRR